MKFNISNHYLSVTVDSLGAELNSIKKSGQDQDYIWQAHPEIWGRHAPILFPIVGRLNSDTYKYDDQEYSLGQHGFARNLEFENLVAESDKLIFELTQNAETLKNYPFKFSLRVTYTLSNNTLFTKYEVSNSDDKDILFSIGGHPGFTCPIDFNSKRSDYYLEFEKDETAGSHILKGGAISDETKSVISGKRITITDDIFDEDALIFKNLKSEKVSLKHKSGETVLYFHFPGFPYLGIWSMSRTSPYVCIEPWFGLADVTNHNGDITSKEGIQSLSQADMFRCEYGIEIV